MDIFEKIKAETIREISHKIVLLSDTALHASGAVNKLLAQFETREPKLDTDNLQITIGKEKCIRYDVPKGYSPGDEFDYVLYAIPIKGSFSMFNRIMYNYPWSENLYAGNSEVFCKIVSLRLMDGNKQTLKRIKEQAKAKIEEISQKLAALHPSGESLHTQLSAATDQLVEAEKARREAIKQLQEQLRPEF